MNADSPFKEWVPKPLGIAVFLLMFVPLMFASGVYLGNISEMTGVTGLWTEDCQMIGSCAFIGMAVFFPFMVPYLQVRDVKLTYIIGFTVLVVLNILLARVESVVLQCVFCFVLGFVRIMLALNTTFAIAPYAVGINTLEMFTSEGETDPKLAHMRSLAISVLYVIIMGLVELSNYVMAWIAYEYTWQFCYELSNIIIGCGAILVMLTMRFGEKKGTRYEIPWGMTGEFLLMIAFLCSTCFTLIYGKTLDWLSSPRIWLGLTISLLSLGAFIFMNTRKRKPYLDFHVFLHRNVWFGIVLFVLAVVCNYGNSLIVSFIKIATPANGIHIGAQSLWCAAGVIIGLLFSVLMIARHVRFKYLFAVGFATMCTANAFLYFEYQPQGLYERMIPLTVLNFAGMIISYVVVCAYGMCGLRPRMLPTWLFLMLAVRNVLSPSLNMAVYSSLMQERQQHFITRFVQDAPSLADAKKVQSSAALVSMKSVTGGIVWLSGICALAIFACPKRLSMKS